MYRIIGLSGVFFFCPQRTKVIVVSSSCGMDRQTAVRVMSMFQLAL
jgi:hypothetical protein